MTLRGAFQGRPGLRPRGAAAFAIVFALLTWFFGGIYGLLAGVVIVGAWLGLRLRPAAYWIASIVLVAAAGLAQIARDLGGAAIGPGYATTHIAAHALVGVGLACAAFAALLEAVAERPGSPFRKKPAAALPAPPSASAGARRPPGRGSAARRRR